MKNYNPKVSIIVNCYNGELFLEKCLLSILRQTYKNWELIFWDNRSTDDSKNIFEKVKNKKFKYFKAKKFTNLYAARNLALKEAKGEIIMFVDVDDEWLEDKIDQQIKIFKKNKKINIVSSNFFREKNIFFFKFKKKFLSNKNKNILNTLDLIKKYQIGWSTIAIKKRLFNFRSKNFNEKSYMISDFEFIINISTRNKVFFINEPLVIYRDHASQLSRKNFFTQIDQYLKWCENVNKNKRLSKYKKHIFSSEKYFFYNNLNYFKKNDKIKKLLSILFSSKSLNLKLKIFLYYLFPKIFIYYLAT